MNDAFAVDMHAASLIRPKRFAQVAMEVREAGFTADSSAALGVFVADGSQFEIGDLVGCYAGIAIFVYSALSAVIDMMVDLNQRCCTSCH